MCHKILPIELWRVLHKVVECGWVAWWLVMVHIAVVNGDGDGVYVDAVLLLDLILGAFSQKPPLQFYTR